MKKKKKGFTLVELVIVIAVIAILAAVLIPTFSSVIKNANNSADTQLVASLNLVAATHQATGDNGEFDSADNIRKMLAEEEGIPATSLTTKNKNNVIVYDTAKKQFECSSLDDLVADDSADSVGYYLEEIFNYNLPNFKMIISTGGNDLAEALYALHNLKADTDIQDIYGKISSEYQEKVRAILEDTIFINENGEAVSIEFSGNTPSISTDNRDLDGKKRIVFYEYDKVTTLTSLP